MELVKSCETREMIVETKGNTVSRNSKSYTTNKPADLDIPVAVLVNGNSASASEIVSGSLQDLDRAVIIGSRTFGKGLVQNVLPMDYNTQMKVTVAKYYIPSGRCVQTIDYSHRDENGRPLNVPDSLKTAFKTKNGRTVYDGFGIEPDVETEMSYMTMLEVTLLRKYYIFDYATLFARQHPTIASPEDFEMTDEIYNDFKRSLSQQHYEYSTATERCSPNCASGQGRGLCGRIGAEPGPPGARAEERQGERLGPGTRPYQRHAQKRDTHALLLRAGQHTGLFGLGPRREESRGGAYRQRPLPHSAGEITPRGKTRDNHETTENT